jgi:hypothetical protein
VIGDENGGVQGASIGVVGVASHVVPAQRGLGTAGTVIALTTGSAVVVITTTVSELAAAGAEAAAGTGGSAIVCTAESISGDWQSRLVDGQHIVSSVLEWASSYNICRNGRGHSNGGGEKQCKCSHFGISDKSENTC